MKKILILFITGCSLLISGQTIPNAGFETWQPYDGAYPVSVPQHYWSLDVLYTAFNANYNGHSCMQTNQSHSGASAVLMQTAISAGDTVSGLVLSNDSVAFTGMPMGFPFTSRPSAIKGFYKLNLVGGDTAVVELAMTKWNGNHRDTLVNLKNVLITNISTYTQFSFPINYLLNQYPDTALIGIGILGPGGKKTHVGTQFYLDDLSFSGSVPLGIKENALENDLISFYPNPFSSSATMEIGHSVNLNTAQIFIYDINGKEVKKIIPANYKTAISKDGLEKGVYFYKLFNNERITTTGKFIIE